MKHFAVNNQETDRARVSAEADERTLREIYLAGFERIVTGAGPWMVMCSYNKVNGTYASQHRGCSPTSCAPSGWGHHAAAILEGRLLGQAGGAAVADLLLGRANPSGRLAETIPLRLQDNPSYLNFPGELGVVRYGEGVFVGYRGYDAREQEVSYPFGHGLSYTGFGYRDLEVTVGDEQDVTASATVTNTGSRAGKEVVQVYGSPPAAAVARPVRELKAFTKIALEPGESRRVTFALTRRDLSYFHPRQGGGSSTAGSSASPWAPRPVTCA